MKTSILASLALVAIELERSLVLGVGHALGGLMLSFLRLLPFGHSSSDEVRLPAG